MATITIANPIGANAAVSDFRTQKNDAGGLLTTGEETYATYRANAAIVKGAAVMLVVATATVPLSVTPMTVAGDARLFAGIAVRAAAAGAAVEVCTRGICEVFVNAQTVAFGDTLSKPGTNAGEASGAATDPDATIIVGSVLGVILGAKNATSLLAPAKISVV